MTSDVEYWTPTENLRLLPDGTILQRWSSVPIGHHEWRAFTASPKQAPDA